MISKYLLGQLLFNDHPMLPEGLYYRYQDREHLLMFITKHATSISFRHTLLSGPAELAFTMQEGILFFLARFGHYQWRKAPYYWHAVPREERSLPSEIEKSDGSSELQILVIDHLIGAIQGVRTVILPPDFVVPLHQAIEQQAFLPNMGGKAYRERQEQVKEKYPHAKDLLAVSVARMIDLPSVSLSPVDNKPSEEQKTKNETMAPQMVSTSSATVQFSGIKGNPLKKDDFRFSH